MLMIGPATRGATICPDLAVAGPGIRDVLPVQQPDGGCCDSNHYQRDQIPVKCNFHGAKNRPIRLPNSAARAAKNSGRCHTRRVTPKCSSRFVTTHADKKPSSTIPIDQGVLKS